MERLLGAFSAERAVAEFFAAYERSIGDNLKIRQKPLRGLDSLAGYEAGKSYVRLVRARGVSSKDEAQSVERVEADIAKLDAKPNNYAITPIVFSIDAPQPLHSRIDPPPACASTSTGTAPRRHSPG